MEGIVYEPSPSAQAAAWYANNGFTVIPLKPNSKEAAINWKEFQKVPATAEQIGQWFWKMPYANVGLVCGATSGLAVLDLDDGDAVAWARERLQATPMIVRSARGEHWYFRHPGGHVANRTGIGGKAIDLRADGGYVVAPPSRHPSGSLYTFTMSPPPVLAPSSLPELPAWLWGDKKKDKALQTLMTEPVPHRAQEHPDNSHNVLFGYACKIIREFAVSGDDLLAALKEWNASLAGENVWSEKELEHKVEDAEKAVAKEEGAHEAALHDRYALILGTTTACDAKLGHAVPFQAIKAEHPGRGERWAQDPNKRAVRPEDIVFEPSGAGAGQINLFTGLPSTPDPSKPCDLIVNHFWWLCGGEEAVFRWLMCWLALPLQKIGTKLQSAVVLVGPQGAGKSFVGDAMLQIYGHERRGGCGTTIGQEALESDFNGWASRKLFVVAEEVVSALNRKNLKNPLKHLITGQSIRINEKFRTAREEANHMNLIFLSNERAPVVLERDDRRFCVIRVPTPAGADYYAALWAQLNAGGAAGLHAHLLGVPLGGFNAATPPPLTQEKLDLIESSASIEDAFLDAWARGELALPSSAAPEQLYASYLTRCEMQKCHPVAKQKLLRVAGTHPHVLKVRDRTSGADRTMYQLKSPWGGSGWAQ